MFVACDVTTDDTELILTQEALRVTDARFRAAQDLSLDAFTILDAVRDERGTIVDFRWAYANPIAGRILRYPPEELVGQRLLAVLPGNKVTSDLFDRYVHVVETGQPHDYELRYQSEGIDGWFRNMTVRLGDGIAVYFTDITARKRAEEQLRTTLESIGDGFFACDGDWRIVYINAAAERILGIHRQQALGKCLWDAFPLTVGTRPASEYRRAAAGELRDFESFYEPWQRWFHNRCFPREGGGMSVYFRDITERKQVEEAVEEARRSLLREKELLQAVMDGAKNSHLVYLDRDFNFLRVNEAYAKKRGYASDEMIGKNHFVLFPDAENEAIFVRVRDTGVSVEFHDKPLIFPERPEGGITYWDWTLTPVKDGFGCVVGLVLSLVETTERKKADAELRASKERFELAVRGAGVGIWDWDIRTGTVYYSPRWKILFGYEENEIGDGIEDWTKLLHPDERKWILEFQEDFLAGTSPTVTAEYRLRHKNGTYRWIMAHAVVVRDAEGKACRLVGSHGDITDRKQAEEQIRLLSTITSELLASDHPQRIVETLCRRVMDRLGCHVFFNFLVDEQQHRLRLNACAGIPEETVRDLEWLDFGTAVCGSVARDGCRIVAEHIQNTPDPRTDLVRSFGIQAYACHPLLNQGRVIGTLSFGTRDDRTFSDGELELMKGVADHVSMAMQRVCLLESLQRHAEAAEAANVAKRQFLANMSHEMRTPLTAIVGYAELLARRDISEETYRKYLHTIQRNGRTLLTLIDHVLDFSKIEAGKMVVKPADCSLREILQDVLSATCEGAERAHLSLDVAYQYPLPDRIRTDPLRLWQVLVNLVGNAIKFTKRGGVRITVSLEPTAFEEQRLRFTVSDTGIGIRPEQRKQVFEPFVQVDGAACAQSGVGLGLAIAARLTELLGGRLELARQSSPGTTFTFTLDPGPLEKRGILWAAPEDSPQEAASDGASASPWEGRILVAEDAPDIQELLRINLETVGLRVDVVGDGFTAVRQALAAAAAGRPYDVVLMDLQMPQLDGYQATRLLRASAWEGPIVALTAHATVDVRDQCRDAGFDRFLSKPVTRATLLATVGQCLEERAGARSGALRLASRCISENSEGGEDSLRADAFPVRDIGCATAQKPKMLRNVTVSQDSSLAVPGERPDARQVRLLALFADDLPQRLARLEHGMRAQDRAVLAQTAHQLAGAAGMFGFVAIEATARMLELRSRAEAPFGELAELLEAVRDAALASPHLPSRAPADVLPAKTAKRLRRVLVVDDDELVRAGLRALVDGLVEFQVVAEAANGREALQLVEQHRPDVVLMDIAMPDLDGLNATGQVAMSHQSTKVIMVSAHAQEETVLQAVRAGAAGYLLKNTSPAELECALSAVTRGETYFCAAVARHLVAACAEDHRSRAKPLKRPTPRQLEVLKRIAEGDSTKMIARKLKISVKTAEHHRTNLMKLLDIHDTASLVRYAVKMGLVSTNE
jgi:PAS domain S-box-containing protein